MEEEIRPLKTIKKLAHLKRMYVIRALKTLNWNRTLTAHALGVSLRYVRNVIGEFRKNGYDIPTLDGNGEPWIKK